MIRSQAMRWPSLAVVLLAGTLACENTGEGLKQDAENAAEQTSQAAEKAGDAVSGAMMTAQVKSAIVADSRIRSGEINVDTDDALKTVTLKGSVMTAEEKVMAGEVATAKAGGYRVVNALVILP